MRRASDIDRDAIGTLALTVLVIAGLAGLPLAVALAWVCWTGLRASRDAAGDVLVVFGKRLRHGRVDEDYRARLTTAARLAAARPRHRIIILGGRTGDAALTEAEAGRRLLHGLPEGARLQIALEQSSSNTLTNLRNLRGLLDATPAAALDAPAGGPAEDAPPRQLTLITNRYHLARVGQMAASLGLPHHRCAAEDRWTALRPARLPSWLIEAVYVCWFLTGKLWAIATRNRRMLARVT